MTKNKKYGFRLEQMSARALEDEYQKNLDKHNMIVYEMNRRKRYSGSLKPVRPEKHYQLTG